MNWLLILVVGILLTFAILGYRKGLIKMIISVASMIITFILVTTFAPRVGSALKETDLYLNVHEKTYEAIADKLDDEINSDEIFSDMTELNEKGTEIIEKLGLPESISEAVIDKIDFTENINTGIEGLINTIAVNLTDYIVDAAIFVISFIIVLLIVKIVFAAINLISYLPIIHGINKFAGLLLGIVEGIGVVWVIFIAVTVLGGTELNGEMFALINSSEILSFLYNNNIIMNLLF